MTNEDKLLLLKDISARLPYKVIVERTYIPENNGYTCELSSYTLDFVTNDKWDIKPYLRPMSSMTKKERQFLLKFGTVGMDENDKVFDVYPFGMEKTMPVIDFLNAHHFDYRGLIEMGLALEAPDDMYKTK